MEVPDPSTVSCRVGISERATETGFDSSRRRSISIDNLLFCFGFFRHGLGGCFGNFHERKLQTPQDFDKKLVVFLGQVPARFLAKGIEHVDDLARAFEIDERVSGLRVGPSTEDSGGVAGEEVHYALKTPRGVSFLRSSAFASLRDQGFSGSAWSYQARARM